MAVIVPRPARLAAVTVRSVRFEERYGTRPLGTWSAPGRVNLIGEHTDYHDGYALPFALPRRTTVAAAATRDLEWTVWSDHSGRTVRFGVAELVPGRVTGWAGYVAGVVWALRTAGFPVPGARLTVCSDVPVGAGLAASAALACAVLTALADLAGLDEGDLPLADRPALAQRAESGYVGVPCGIMDQSASLRCRAGHALFLDCRSGTVEQVRLDLTGAGLALLVVDTRVRHRLAGGEYAARRTTGEQAAQALGVPALRDVPITGLDAALARLADPVARRRVRHVVTENQRVLETVAHLRAGAVRDTGPLLSASHASLRDDYQVTVPELDLAAETAESAGALGARMTGAGFGGCLIALVEVAAADRVAAAVAGGFAARGYAAPEWFLAQPSSAATRLD
jgi:galactokinase